MAQSRLRVEGVGNIPVNEIREFLWALEHAYNSIYAFLGIFDFPHEPNVPPSFIAGRPKQRRPRVSSERAYESFAALLEDRILFIASWPPTPESVSALVPPQGHLILSSVRLGSPGYWEFVAKLNPLEVFRQYLQDRHERRKDREYREGQEARRMDLENQLLENRIISERVEIAKKLGATDTDLVPLLNTLVSYPLKSLDHYQDRGIIFTAKFTQQEEHHRTETHRKIRIG
jgi:hypothetical protein